ncbi:MAG TPA: hypothetical protein VKA68_09235 [bacterium]|nr:hypothetical protein [bacterium]
MELRCKHRGHLGHEYGTIWFGSLVPFHDNWCASAGLESREKRGMIILSVLAVLALLTVISISSHGDLSGIQNGF